MRAHRSWGLAFTLTVAALVVGFAGAPGAASARGKATATSGKSLVRLPQRTRPKAELLGSRPAQTFRARVGVDTTDVENRFAALDMGWSGYHAFRRHFDPVTGAAVTANEPVDGALFPIPATVELRPFYADHPTTLCPTTSVQSDRDGRFEFTLPACPSNLAFRTPDMIVARVVLDFEMRGALSPFAPYPQSLGQIRGVWDDAKAQPLYPHDRGELVYTSTEGTPYYHPSVTVAFSPKNGPQPAPGATVHDLGIQELGAELPSAIEGSLRIMLSAWQKVIEMHHRLYERFLIEDDVVSYMQMFVDRAGLDCFGCYSVVFDSPNFGVYGAHGLMLMNSPAPDIVWLDTLGPVSHEFGHSIHGALAPSSMGPQMRTYAFANAGIDPDGNLSYGLHHGQENQEMGTAYIEGIATTLGEYLVNGCDAPRRANVISGGPPPTQLDANLKPAPTCDGAPKCSHHNFRWQMELRGIEEGSVEWELREQFALDAFYAYQGATNQFRVANGGTRNITSNSETRVALFACDLLTQNTDIRHGDGVRAGHAYTLDGYVGLHGMALSGVEPTYEVLHYTEDVEPKTFTLSLRALLHAMEDFVPDDAEFPLNGEREFTGRRLSVKAHLSPQTLGLYLIDEGHLTRDELNNVLRANYMEEATWPTPKEDWTAVALDDERALAPRREDLPVEAQPLAPNPVLSGEPAARPMTGVRSVIR